MNRTHKIYFDKARKSDMKAKSGSNNSATSKLVRRAAQMPEQTLEFGSMPSDGRSPHDQLRMFAELLLMQSQPYYRAGMSSDAWFPADRFVVQFQQHKCAPPHWDNRCQSGKWSLPRSLESGIFHGGFPNGTSSRTLCG